MSARGDEIRSDGVLAVGRLIDGVALLLERDHIVAERGPRSLGMAERLRYESTPASRGSAFLAGRLLLRDAVALLGVDPGGIEVSVLCPDCGGPHGSPRVAGSDDLERIRVSISHTDGTTLVAATLDTALGVDIEATDAALPTRRGVVVDSIAEWTRVEAVLKADGRGLRVDPSRVRMTGSGTSRAASVAGDPRHYRVIDLDLAAGFHVGLALETP